MSAHQRLRAFIAADRATSRRIDADGRLHVEATPLTAACVSPYLGREIIGADRLGLDPDRIYKLLRDPGELERAAPTFNALPILMGHAPVSADDPQPEIVCGATGSEARFVDPIILNSVVVWRTDAIRDIQSGATKDLSAGYRYSLDWAPGNFNGERYDGRMTNIEGSHVALVREGRVPGAMILDGIRKFG